MSDMTYEPKRDYHGRFASGGGPGRQPVGKHVEASVHTGLNAMDVSTNVHRVQSFIDNEWRTVAVRKSLNVAEHHARSLRMQGGLHRVI
jgi:hypothetical protein